MNAVQHPHASSRRGGKSATAFRTISEAANELDLPQHVLRFWESKFPQIRPMKRGGGRRYYRPEDMDLLRRIRSLLYEDGYTIKGVQKILRDPHGRHTATPDDTDDDDRSDEASSAALEPQAAAAPSIESAGNRGPDRAALREILAELEAIRRLL
jgi:DNA-binding transcriptional MerR regulator